MENRGLMKPLVRCPLCNSTLIYPVHCFVQDQLSCIDRRCPDCGHRDRVRTNRLAAEVWHRRNAHIGEQLAALAAALADGLEPDLAVLQASR
jgi:hypothetical protein